MSYRSTRPRNTFWKDDLGMLRMIWVFLIGLLALAFFFAVAFGIGHEVEEHNCAMAGDQYHRVTVFDDVSFNCYVQTTDGRRVRLGTYITTHEERRESR